MKEIIAGGERWGKGEHDEKTGENGAGELVRRRRGNTTRLVIG